jgi:superfamily I DNA/RNA helicase
MAKKVKIQREPVGAARRAALECVVPLPAQGAGAAAFLESGTHAAAKQITPAAAELLYFQLVFALWLVVSKTKMRHRQIGAFMSRLAEQCPRLPKRRELDLWIRMLLLVLYKYGYLPTADIKFFRHDAAPLHDVTHPQLKTIAADYEILRALQAEFGPKKKELKPEEVILGLLVALRTRLEESPDALSDAARSEFKAIQELIRKKISPVSLGAKSVIPRSSAAVATLKGPPKKN